MKIFDPTHVLIHPWPRLCGTEIGRLAVIHCIIRDRPVECLSRAMYGVKHRYTALTLWRSWTLIGINPAQRSVIYKNMQFGETLINVFCKYLYFTSCVFRCWM